MIKALTDYLLAMPSKVDGLNHAIDEDVMKEDGYKDKPMPCLVFSVVSADANAGYFFDLNLGVTNPVEDNNSDLRASQDVCLKLLVEVANVMIGDGLITDEDVIDIELGRHRSNLLAIAFFEEMTVRPPKPTGNTCYEPPEEPE